MEAKRLWGVLLICSAIALACAIGLPLIGSANISYAKAWAGGMPDHAILFEIRLPRVLLAMLSGGALALSGVLFQALLRDALATPYTLGVSSGASLGAVLAICIGLPSVWIPSMLGAGLTNARARHRCGKARALSVHAAPCRSNDQQYLHGCDRVFAQLCDLRSVVRNQPMADGRG